MAAVTWDSLRSEVGADSSLETVLTRCVDVALPLVTRHVFGSEAVPTDYPDDAALNAALVLKKIPRVVWDEAHLVTAAELFHQRKAPNGVLNQQYATGDGSGSVPVRISRDPLKPARALLHEWLSFNGQVL